MDRFSALRTLVAAVDGGSLSAASRRLRTPLPTVSRRISDLEAHLGTQLLLRTPRKLVLTDAGAAFVPAARRILAALDEAEREASGEYREPVGELLVTAPIAFGRIHILPVVLEFLQAFPGIDVRLAMSDAVVDMIDNHVDVAVRLGRLPDSSLIAQAVGEVRWITVASPAYLAARGTPEVPADLLHVSSSMRYDLMTGYDLGIKDKVFVNRGHDPGNPYYGYTEVRGIDGLAALLGV